MAELIDRYWSPALLSRRDSWYASLVDALNGLVERVAGLEDIIIQSDEEFLTVVIRASVAAQETHEKEKLEALRAAVLNTPCKLRKHQVLS